MKVLVFSPYYPPHIGGLETHADEFNKYLSAKGADIVVFTPRLPESAPEKEVIHSGVKVIRFPAFEIIPNYPLPCFWKKVFWNLWREIKREKYDWVVSRTRFFLTSFWAGRYARKKNTPWLHIEHGSDFVKLNSAFHSSLARLYDYTLGRWVIKKADRVVANSEASADFSRKLYDRPDIGVIYRGVEIEKIEKAEPNRDMQNDKVKICFLGRLIDGKGVADLLKAVSGLNDGNWELHVVGDGPRRESLEKLADGLNISQKVTFWGYQKFDAAIGILKACDIVVNPSYTEGLPTSIIEAALCRKAIVATDVGGTREIITDGKSGYLVEAKKIDQLTGKLKELIRDAELRKSFGENACQEASEKFDWEKNIGKYYKILE